MTVCFILKIKRVAKIYLKNTLFLIPTVYFFIDYAKTFNYSQIIEDLHSQYFYFEATVHVDVWTGSVVMLFY